ncbi:50S ribosomal protein L21, mitochondrial-like protein [Tanacetum coccineum]
MDTGSISERKDTTAVRSTIFVFCVNQLINPLPQMLIILNKVLMLGSKTQTMIGRPVLPEAAVYAIVEEHALDAKVIIFKKKRRKNYRRKKGHRQESTKLRIIDIQGIEKPEIPIPAKTEKSAAKVEKAAVAA